MIEQVIANTIRDVNFTSVVLLMLENNETMNKIQENVDIDAVIRTIVRGIDQEKLAIGFFNAASKEFDLEYFVANLINRTNLEKLHDDLLINGTLPEGLLKTFHPDLNQRVFQRFISTIKNFTTKLFLTIRKNEQQQNFFFKILLDKSLSSMKNFVDKLQRSNAKTFDEFFESFANKTNDLIFEMNLSVGQRPITTTTTKPIDDDNDADIDPSEAIFQWSIVFNAIGETSHVFLKSFEQLFCQIEWKKATLIRFFYLFSSFFA